MSQITFSGQMMIQFSHQPVKHEPTIYNLTSKPEYYKTIYYNTQIIAIAASWLCVVVDTLLSTFDTCNNIKM